MALVEAPETLDELAAVPRLVRGPCLLNVVHRGRSPAVDLRQAEAMGYRLAIIPALLLMATIGACDAALAALRDTGCYPAEAAPLSVGEAFARVGAREWEPRRTRFRA